MNFKDWKKVKEDGKTVTMSHPSGHSMTIITKSLPKIQQEQLKRIKMAEGGKVKHYAGTDDSDGPVVEAYSDPSANIAPAPAAATQSNPLATQDPSYIPLNPPSETPPAQASGQDLTNPLTASGLPAQAQQTGVQGINAQAAVDVAKAAGMQNIAQQQADAAKNAALQQQQTVADMQKRTQAFADYMNNNPINENAYMENRTSGQKMQQALALGLGGIGGGISGHGGNVASDFYNRQIDRNIDAQKARANQQTTVYGAYKDLYREENTSTALTKASMYDKAIADTNMLAAKLGTPQAEANRLKMVSDFELQKNDQIQKAANTHQAFLDQQVPPTMAPQGVAPASGQGQAQRAASGTMTPIGYSPSTPAGNAPQPGMIPYGTQEGETKTPVQPFQHILSPQADREYKNLANNQPNLKPEQVNTIQQQYLKAKQVDKAMDQMSKLLPELKDRATWGGYLASKANTLGTVAGAGMEAAGLAGAVPTAGASLLGALPGAVAAGAATREGVKSIGNAIGGQQEMKYQNSRKAFVPILTSALVQAGIAPTEASELAEQFVPTKMTDNSTYKDILEKVHDKLSTTALTGGLPERWLNGR